MDQDIIRFAHVDEPSRPGTWTPVLHNDYGMPSALLLRCPKCGFTLAVNLDDGIAKVMMGMLTPPQLCRAPGCKWASVVCLDKWPPYVASGKPTPYFGDRDPGNGAGLIVDEIRHKGEMKQYRYIFPARDVREYHHACMIGDILRRMDWLVNIQTWDACGHVRLYVTKNPDVHEAASLRLARFGAWQMETWGELIPEWARDDEALVSF